MILNVRHFKHCMYAAAFFVAGIYSVYAQNLQHRAVGPNVETLNIAVVDIETAPATLKAGSKAAVTFNFVNDDSTDYADVFVVMYLEEIDPETYAAVRTYPEVRSGPYFFARNAATPVEINYTAPVYGNPSNNLQLHVLLINRAGGILFGTRANLNVQGLIPGLHTTNAGLFVNGKGYVPQSGPVVEPTDTVILEGAIFNEGRKNEKVYPTLKLYDRTKMGTLLIEKGLEPFTVVAGMQYSYYFELPVPEKPNAYLAEVQLNNAEGGALTEPLHGRYIVNGKVASILSAKVDVDSFEEGQPFNLSIEYAGPPFNIYKQAPMRRVVGPMSVTLTTKAGQQIASFEETFAYNAIGLVQKQLIAGATANFSEIHVTIKSNGQLVTQYTGYVGNHAPEIGKPGVDTKIGLFESSLLAKYWSSVAAILIIVLGFIYFKRKNS